MLVKAYVLRIGKKRICLFLKKRATTSSTKNSTFFYLLLLLTLADRGGDHFPYWLSPLGKLIHELDSMKNLDQTTYGLRLHCSECSSTTTTLGLKLMKLLFLGNFTNETALHD